MQIGGFDRTLLPRLASFFILIVAVLGGMACFDPAMHGHCLLNFILVGSLGVFSAGVFLLVIKPGWRYVKDCVWALHLSVPKFSPLSCSSPCYDGL